MPELIHIDGSIGGGQILRSALSLSMLTGKPFVIDQIRKRRGRPGLMRQHLTAVQAAARVCGAELDSAELGSTQLAFRPGAVRPGSYTFAISTAGSACLVLQTVLPPLMRASAPSELTFEGGTHNPLAPPYPFLDRVFFPLIERMGVGLSRSMSRPGFYPAGGGRFEVQVTPCAQLASLELMERGELQSLSAEAWIANLPHHIAQRELAVAQRMLSLDEAQLHLRTPEASGPGNVLLLIAQSTYATEMVIGFGERDVRAEHVAERACEEMQRYLHAEVPVGEHLADQLLIPLAMAGAGAFRTLRLSDHARSNMQIVERFLPVRFVMPERTDRSVVVRLERT